MTSDLLTSSQRVKTRLGNNFYSCRGLNFGFTSCFALFPDLTHPPLSQNLSPTCVLCFFLSRSPALFQPPFSVPFVSFWTWLSYSLRMESLELARLLLCANPALNKRNSEGIRHLGFDSLLKRASRNGSLRLRSSLSGGNSDSQSGDSPFEDEGQERKKERALLLSKETDASGFLIGFHLIPESGTIIKEDAIADKVEQPDDGILVEESEDTEGDEKAQTRVSYNIVFVTSEAAPYSKTGGLADVCGSLPIALASRGHRVMVVSPRYLRGTSEDCIYSGTVYLDHRINIYCFGGVQEVGFFHEYREGVDWVFVDHTSFHRPGNPYGDNYGAFGDNQFRFTLLCHAACEAPLVLPLGGFTYGEKCLFLANDWHASLVPVLLGAKYRPYGVYKDARSVLVIHNLAHQGVEPAITYSNLGLPPEWRGALEWVFPTWARTHALDPGEAVNFLKGAIVTADRILTVSKGYCWEIMTSEGGFGLHELLGSRRSVLDGITNGIDAAEWDPSSDEHIACHYSADDLSGKVQCKISLQKELGLPVRPDCPLIGFIGRLDYQKGINLIRLAIPELMEDDVQFVMLGSGDPIYEDWMRATESAYRDKFRGWVGFDVPVSHRITAGCDILLMPSAFEPCGLNQLYAMKYGTIPVVHDTGGLRDTVQHFNPFADGGNGDGTGWTFSPLTKESMLAALRYALLTYKEYKSSWEGLMKRGMRSDFTWENAATQYEQVFEWAFSNPPYGS